MAKVSPGMSPMRDRAMKNMSTWARLADTGSQENGFPDIQEPPDPPPCPEPNG